MIVLNQNSAPRNDLTEEENSARTKEIVPKLLLLGGDDYILDNHMDFMVGKSEQTQITIVLYDQFY